MLQKNQIESFEDALIMAPSLGFRFSGINATMEALLPVMRRSIPIACCGANLSDKMPRTTLWRWLRSKNRRQWRIWHARRNNDMLIGLFLRHVLRQKVILLFTSAAQREHTWLTKFCYRRMDAVIATTEKAARFLHCESTVSHHGVDTTTFKPPGNRQVVRRTLHLDDRPTLGVFGRVRPQKGTGDLVEALLQILPKYPDWQIVFIGAITEAYVPFQTDLAQRLKIAGLTDRVHFRGFLEDFSQLPMWYQAIDVVGCFSRNEGFGVTCLEGMASGVPVVATQAGAWPDILTEGKDGWLAEAGDPDDIAQALNKAFSKTPEQLQHLGRTAKQTVLERFTIEHEANRIKSVYQDLFHKYEQSLPSLFADSSPINSAA